MKDETVKRRVANGATGNNSQKRGVHAAATPVKRRTSSVAAAAVDQTVNQAKPRASSQTYKLWQLRLYVMGQTTKSMSAFSNLKKICESQLKGRYRITVIDLKKQPHLAQGDQILAIPTVVRRLPKPVRTIIGSFSDTARALIGLDLRAAAD
jgi:circadian clock protein KaiB